jgi:uncharacterized protein
MEDNNPLVFKYADIVDSGGHNVKLSLPAADYADAFERPDTLKRVEIEMDFSVGGDSVLLEGRAAAVLALDCARCGEPVTRSFEDAFDEVYPDSLEYIDTREVVRETVALLAPIKILCSDGCKGRCLVCGVNRNLQTCTCKAEYNSSFQALKDLKVNKPENPGKKQL